MERSGCGREPLRETQWLNRAGVQLEDQDEMETSEDAFDAGITAAALLRIVLERLPPHASVDPIAEGGILGTGSVRLDLPEARFGADMGGLEKTRRLGALNDLKAQDS